MEIAFFVWTRARFEKLLFFCLPQNKAKFTKQKLVNSPE
jgi:hypothetical protein